MRLVVEEADLFINHRNFEVEPWFGTMELKNTVTTTISAFHEDSGGKISSVDHPGQGETGFSLYFLYKNLDRKQEECHNRKGGHVAYFVQKKKNKNYCRPVTMAWRIQLVTPRRHVTVAFCGGWQRR